MAIYVIAVALYLASIVIGESTPCHHLNAALLPRVCLGNESLCPSQYQRCATFSNQTQSCLFLTDINRLYNTDCIEVDCGKPLPWLPKNCFKKKCPEGMQCIWSQKEERCIEYGILWHAYLGTRCNCNEFCTQTPPPGIHANCLKMCPPGHTCRLNHGGFGICVANPKLWTDFLGQAFLDHHDTPRKICIEALSQFRGMNSEEFYFDQMVSANRQVRYVVESLVILPITWAFLIFSSVAIISVCCFVCTNAKAFKTNIRDGIPIEKGTEALDLLTHCDVNKNKNTSK